MKRHDYVFDCTCEFLIKHNFFTGEQIEIMLHAVDDKDEMKFLNSILFAITGYNNILDLHAGWGEYF